MGWLTILKFVGGNWQIFAIIGILSGGYFYHSNLIGQIEDLTEDNTRLTTQVAECNSKVAEQNGKIEFWVNKGREQDAALEKLKGILNTTKIKHDEEVADILNEPKPKTCQAAIDYLVDGVGDLK